MRSSLPALALLTSVLATSGAALADDKHDCITASESAQKLRDDRHLGKAREQFLTCARDVCPAAIRKDCSEAMADLDKRMPSLVFHAKDPKGTDLVAVRVTVDGTLVTDTLDGKAVRVDPGVHAVHLETAGQDPVDQKIMVGEGERDRPVAVNFGKPEEPGSTKRAAPVGAFVIGGIGIVAIGVGAVFYGLGLSQRSGDLNGACGTQANCDSEKTSISTKLVLGDVLTGIGIVGVVSGVVWMIVHYTGGNKEKAPAATALDFRPLPGGGVGTVGFSF